MTSKMKEIRRDSHKYLHAHFEKHAFINYPLSLALWKMFDIFSLTKPVLYSPLFADNIHFPGHLTRLTINNSGFENKNEYA